MDECIRDEYLTTLLRCSNITSLQFIPCLKEQILKTQEHVNVIVRDLFQPVTEPHTKLCGLMHKHIFDISRNPCPLYELELTRMKFAHNSFIFILISTTTQTKHVTYFLTYLIFLKLK